MKFESIIRKIGERLDGTLARQEWDAAKSNLNSLSEVVVEALMIGADDDIANINELVHRCHRAVVAAEGQSEPKSSAIHLAGQMESLSCILSIANERRRSLTPGEVDQIMDTASVAILQKLNESEKPLSGIDLRTN